MRDSTIEEINAGLADLMREKLGVGGRDLSRRRRRAGRLLPRRVRRDLRFLEDQQTLAGHPRLRMQIDSDGVLKAARRVKDWLDTVDPAKRRTDRLLGTLAVIAFNLLVVAALFIAWLVWRGYV